MCDKCSVKIEEYKALLEEHKRNRSYIFERTIIILGIVAASLKMSVDEKHFYYANIIVAILMFLFSYNLKFTVHRLRSDARIIAYLQIFHEGFFNYKWIGWENSLREYRIWESVHKKNDDLERLANEGRDPRAIPGEPAKKTNKLLKLFYNSKGIMSYPSLWNLHIWLTILIWIFLLMLNFEIKVKNTFDILSEVVLVLSALFFLLTAFWTTRPSRIIPFIERERTVWIHVVDEDLNEMFTKPKIGLLPDKEIVK